MSTIKPVHKLTDHVRPFAFDKGDAMWRLRTASPRHIERDLIDWNKKGWLDDKSTAEVATRLLRTGSPEQDRVLRAIAAASDTKTPHHLHIDQETSIDATIKLAGPIRALDTRRNGVARAVERYALGAGSVLAGTVFVAGFTKGLNGSLFPLVLDLDGDKVLPTRSQATPDQNVDSRIFKNGQVDRQRLVDRFNEISRGKNYYTLQDLKDATDKPSIFIKAAELCLLHEVAAQVNNDGEKVMTLGGFIRFYEGSLFPEISRQRVDAYEAKTSKLDTTRGADIASLQAFFGNAGGPEAHVVAAQHQVGALALEDVIMPSKKQLAADGGGLTAADLGVVDTKNPGKSINFQRTYDHWQTDKSVALEALLRPMWWAFTGNRYGRTEDNRPQRPFATPVEA